MGNPEQDARGEIDQLLVQAGWHVCDAGQANITACRGVAIREFPLPGHGWVPKTLIFAKDDAHAENIVDIVREESTSKRWKSSCSNVS